MEGKYVQMTLNDWLALKGQLEAELRGAAAGFVRIGYLLRKIDETEGYKMTGRSHWLSGPRTTTACQNHR